MNNISVRCRELDAFRGIAAVAVVFFHFTMGRPEADLGFKFGTTGVDLFFIISGFVISMSINNVSSGTEFIANRISRLYPVYWVCVTLSFLIQSLYKYICCDADLSINSWWIYLANLTMFQYYFNIPDIEGPYWTMIIEMIFYVFILILYVSKKIRYINVISVAICCICIISFFLKQYPVVSDVYTIIPLLNFYPLFFAGILFYQIYISDSILLKKYGLLVLCLFSQIVLFYIGGRSKAYIGSHEYALILLIYFTMFTAFVNGWLKFIAVKPLLYLGKISFSLYLIHQYFSINILIPYLVNDLKINFLVSTLLITFPATLLIASLITYTVEVPFSPKFRSVLYRWMRLSFITKK